MGVRSSIPGTICPSSGFGPQALQTCPIVCVCPSRKWWARLVLVAQKAPPSTARACCSLAYMWQREGGCCSRALRAVTSGPSTVCAVHIRWVVMSLSSNRWLRGKVHWNYNCTKSSMLVYCSLNLIHTGRCTGRTKTVQSIINLNYHWKWSINMQY